MKTFKQACTPRATTFEPAWRETVVDLSERDRDPAD